MLKNTKIIQRLAALLLVNIALMALVGALGYFGMASIREGLRTVYEDRTIALEQVDNIQADYYEVRLSVLAAIRAADPAAATASKDAADKNVAAAAETWKAYLGTSFTPEEAELTKA